MMPNLDGVDVVTLAPELPGSHDVIRSLAGGSSSGRRSNATAADDDDDDDDGGDDSSSNPTDGPRRRTSSRSRRRRRPVVVSLGHTNATYDDGVAALSCGATLITHLYNAMESFHHRNPGLAGLLSSPCVLGRLGLVPPYWSIIVDGVHVHESAVRMAYRAHPGGCVLVTDAMSAMGLDGGDDVDCGGGGSAASATTLGSVRAVISPGGDRAVVDDGIGSTLAGSVSPMDGCVRRFMSYVDCPAGDALLCATRNPAMVLGRHVDAGGRGRRRRRRRVGGGGAAAEGGDGDGPGPGMDDDDDDDVDDDDDADAPIGVLDEGARADVVMLDDDLVVLATWVDGRLAYRREEESAAA